MKVLLTGATGNMGREGLRQINENRDKYKVVVFALPTKKDKKLLARYRNDDRVSVIWGDLTNYEEVKSAVETVDIVLHVGALVSPMADRMPELAWKINFGGTKNIVDAILSRPDSDKVKLVYVGTVAETGNRAAPYHWGRVGDPVLPSPYDYYALSKIAAERYVIESGLKYWVSVRQTGIMHKNIIKMNDGIGYHQPLNNHLEWVSAGDSGKLLLNICSGEIPEEFWGNVYNIGGGESCRLTAYQFTDKMYKMMGVDFRELEDPNWYALRNFHGQWYYDSDKLNDFLNFRAESVDDVVREIKKKLPLSMRLLRFLPRKWVKEKIMRPQATTENSPLYWMKHNLEGKIRAFFGSRDNWEKIPGWEEFKLVVDPPHQKLHHGYDENKPDTELGLPDLQQAARFRGGSCLSDDMSKGDLQTKRRWKCAHDHDFEASPYLVLKAGHWCEECMKAPWSFDEIARSNPFMAQLWHNDHAEDEDYRYA